MRIVDGEGVVLGRLASYVAKEALKGEEISVVNCEKIAVTGRKETIQREFEETTRRRGSHQRGPKISKLSERVVKRAIRGMLPTHKSGRGKDALSKIKCYKGVPKEMEKEKLEKIGKGIKTRYVQVGDYTK